MEGWIKLYRKFCEWQWYNNSEMVHLFIHLLLNANREDRKWRNITVKRGEIITGRLSLSHITGISERQIRTCLNRLKSTSEIAIKTTNKYSIITILKYDDYQDGSNQSGQQSDQQTVQQATNKCPTNDHKQEYKEDKNIRNKNNKKADLPTKSADFIDQIIESFISIHKNYVIVNKGKERAAASKILKVYKSKNPEATTETTLAELTNYFGRCVTIEDPWLNQNMSLPIIVSKFNEINTILRNGKIKRNSSKASDGSTLEDVATYQAADMGIKLQ